MKRSVIAAMLVLAAVLTTGGCDNIACPKGQHVEMQTQAAVDANGDATTVQVPVCVNN